MKRTASNAPTAQQQPYRIPGPGGSFGITVEAPAFYAMRKRGPKSDGPLAPVRLAFDRG